MKWYTTMLCSVILFLTPCIFFHLEIKRHEDREADLTTDIGILKAKLMNQIKNGSDLKIDPKVEISDSSGKIIPLQSILNGGKKMIFRLTELNCQLCFEGELPRLKKLAEAIGKNNIIFLASYQNINGLKIFKHNYNIDLPVYNIPMKDMAINKIETFNIPYIFLLDNKLKSEMVFIPEKAFPDLSVEYYNTIQNLDIFSKQ